MASIITLVHLKGTSKESLIEQYAEAYNAVGAAQEALQKASPNGRNYYPLPAGSFEKARNEYIEQAKKLAEVRTFLESLIIGIDEQGS
jgi:hypothetical protein